VRRSADPWLKSAPASHEKRVNAVVLTGHRDEAMRVPRTSSGRAQMAHAFLIKPCSPWRLLEPVREAGEPRIVLCRRC